MARLILLKRLMKFALPGLVCLAAGSAGAQTLDALAERGEQLYNAPASCWVCHGERSEGRIGPSLQYGPTPYDIRYQLGTNAQMAAIRETLRPSNQDFVALAVYLRRLNQLPVSEEDVATLQASLNVDQQFDPVPGFFLTERDRLVERVESFDTVLEDWQRRARRGSIRRDYNALVVAEFEPGEPRFQPQPGHTYFYENTGTSGRFRPGSAPPPASAQVVVGDARSKEVIASYMIPQELRGGVHATVMSPDARFVYIIGAAPFSDNSSIAGNLRSPQQSLLKVDALTLQPVKQIMLGMRLHHGQVFQDRYLLLDSFARDADSLDIMLFDPETDSVVGGVSSEDLGGSPYTAWTDNRHIYVLMEPMGYGGKTITGYSAASRYGHGELTTIRPFWVARIDPQTWEVDREYPYPGYRGDWIAFDSASEHMYVPAAGSSNLHKINLDSGEIVWSTPTGTGPYGVEINADETELWVADKGETTGMFGRSITVIDNASGNHLETLFSGYQVDHILLAPNGREFWATSNAEGRIYVFDADSRQQTHVIDMPGFGDPHGLVWVHYDEAGVARVVKDQGTFHNGVDPRRGTPLRY